MTNRWSLKFPAVLILFVSSVFLFSFLLVLGLYSHQNSLIQQTQQQVSFQKDSATELLGNSIRNIVNISHVLGNSVSLRRAVTGYSKRIMELPEETRNEFVKKEIELYKSRDRSDEIVRRLMNSSEFDFLKATIQTTDNVIDQIEVTDAFGFLRISTNQPENLYVFYQDWWQRAVSLQYGNVYYDFEHDFETGDYVYFSLPLLDDEGFNPVGVIRLRLDLKVLFAKLRQGLYHEETASIFVTDNKQIYPTKQTNIPFSIGELITFSRKSPDIFQDNKLDYIVGIGTVSGRITQVLPEIKWSVIVYQARPNVFSFSHPEFQKAFIIWIMGILCLGLLSAGISNRLEEPVKSWISVLREFVEGNYNAHTPITGSGSFSEINELINKLGHILSDSSSKTGRTIRESNAALSAFEDFTQEAALEQNRRTIADALLRLSLRRLNADAGVLIIQNPDYKDPMVLKYHITDEQIDRFDTLTLDGTNSKQIFLAWENPEHQSIWNDGFQVILGTPVRTRHTHYGTLYLLFYQAVSTDIKEDRTVELLALQAAVYSSRSGLYHRLGRQISFNEGILSGIPWFICTLDSSLRITWHNNQIDYLKMDNSEENLITSKCCKTFRRRDSVCPDCPARQTLLDGRSHEIDQRWISEDNSIRWMKVNSFPFQDETGQMKSVILFIRDITAENRAQAEVRQLSRAVDNIGEAIIITDMNGQIQFVNQAFTKIMGFSEDEITENSIDIVIPQHGSDMYHDIQCAVQKDQTWSRDDVQMLKRNQESISMSITVSLVKDENGLPLGQVFTCFDISRRLIREKQFIKQFRELEALHNSSTILSQHTDFDDLLRQLLNHLTEFAGCQAGCVLLFDHFLDDEANHNDIRIDASKPLIRAEQNIPGFFVKFIEEIRQGRESDLYQKACSSERPIVMNNIRSQDSLDSKLINRMGFKSMMVIPILTSQINFGLILLFSRSPFHFNDENLDIFNSLSNQYGISFHRRYLEHKLSQEAHFALRDRIANRIGGDVKQVLQGLEISRHLLEKALEEKSWSKLDHGWLNMNRHIWYLYQVTMNILTFNSPEERLFFPENLVNVIQYSLDQITSQSFARRIKFSFDNDQNRFEVYINKRSIQRILVNMLLLVIDTCWFTESPEIKILLRNNIGMKEQYGIDICHNGEDFEQLNYHINHSDQLFDSGDLPVLLANTVRILNSHRGKLRIQTLDSNLKAVRIVLPRYPQKK